MAGGSRRLGADAMLSAGGSLVGGGFGALSSIVIARELGVEDRGSSAAVLALALLCATAVTLGLPTSAGYMIAPTTGLERARTARAAIIAAVMLGSISSATSLVAAALGLVALARAGVIGQKLGREPVADVVLRLRTFVGYALMVCAATALTQVVQRVDVLIVDGFRGADDAGLYAVAVQMSDLLLVVPAALGAVLFRRGARGEVGHWADFKRALRWTVAGAITVGAAFAIVAPDLIDLAVGAQYADSAPALRLLMPGAVLLATQGVIGRS